MSEEQEELSRLWILLFSFAFQRQVLGVGVVRIVML
jgi:hypothetical protein